MTGEATSTARWRQGATAALGAVAGVVLTVAALAALRGPGQPGSEVAGIRPSCGVAIVLFSPEGLEERLIDAASGGLGFSHVAIDGCEVDPAGAALLFDCQPSLGLLRRPEADYGQRRRARVWLPWCEGRELYGCVRGRLGLPYDALGLVVPKTGPVGGVVCSQLVFECMPAALRERVPPWPSSRPVAPNDLARAFGVTAGGPDVTL